MPSGTPTIAEVHTQLTNTVAVLERLRAFVEGSTYLLAGGAFDTLIQSLEGVYTPYLTNVMRDTRARIADILSSAAARAYLEPILLEYSNLIGYGGAYRDPAALMRALYEHFHANSITVEDRAITFDTSFTAGAGNVGNGACSRLTADENNYPLQLATIEKKILRCRRDQNSGAEEEAEEFELLGATPSPDGLLLSTLGSGVQGILVSHHAGTGPGGSLLYNSSFSLYDSSATNKFTGWVASGAGAASIAQDTTNYYRSAPGLATNGSLEMTGGAGTITLKQALSAMPQRLLNPEVPYFLRIMLAKSIGSPNASGGTVTIRMGSTTASVTIAGLGAGWNELLIAPGQNSWFRNFEEDPTDIEIEWSSSTSGKLLIDDVIFAPFDLVDGTYWFIRGNAGTHAPWMLDDTLEVTDTGGAPATAKVQWWLVRSGLGYLPSTTGTPTVSEPS